MLSTRMACSASATTAARYHEVTKAWMHLPTPASDHAMP